MTELPLATVAITAYQYEAFVARAIDSALALDWPADRLEVLVIDDGSTDRTPEILASYGDRIRFIRTPNRGVAAAVALSLTEARGEIIALLAADDEVPPDRLRRQWEVLSARPAVGLVYGDMELIDASSVVHAASFAAKTKMVPIHGPGALGPLLWQNTVSGGPSTIRASLVDAILPMPSATVHEDWWIALKAAELSEIAYVDAPVYRYRHHGANMNLGASRDKTMALWLREVRFRRFVLCGDALDLSGVSDADLRRAVTMMDIMARDVAEHQGRWMDDVFEVTDGAREASRVALDAGEAVRALALDPSNVAARHAVGVFEETVTERFDARSRVTVALAREVLAAPSLLEPYLAAVAPDDDATLVLYGPNLDPHSLHDALSTHLPQLLQADAPDVLVHAPRAGSVAERELLDRASAVLTGGAHLAGGLPRFSAEPVA